MSVSIAGMLSAYTANDNSGQTENDTAINKTSPDILYQYFPSQMHAFIWCNWESVPLDRMAKVLDTTSLIRRNWHLISYDQILTLLNWNAGQLDQTLRDDDFLWVKVGGMKPDCPPLQYIPPSLKTKKRCAEIKKIVEENFGEELNKPQEERFAFIQNLSVMDENYDFSTYSKKATDESIRFIYSYFAPFGDPLLHPDLNPFPDGLLQSLAKQGINGVWLHVVLHQLTSSNIFPELGKDHDGFGTLCTSVPMVRQWVKESLTNVFAYVPELGGVFTITGSENLTNCWSKQHGDQCPRCSGREPAEVIAEVNKAIAEGVWEGNPDAKVIVWDWGWPDGTAWGKNTWAADIIKQLPDNVYHMSVSEWSLPLHRGGIKTTVGEYSISAVGPGPRALRLWDMAKSRNLKTIAKVQVNNTWELSAIPYLPVMNLIGEHIKNLQKENLDGLMLSWSLGGYPSPNLELVKYIQDHPSHTLDQSLLEIAVNRYGKESAPEIVKAWGTFSSAFTEFPYGLSVYTAPMNYGVSNPFYPDPTGKKATMLGFPFDDLDKWRGVYPAGILADQFVKLADEWEKGLPYFKNALEKAENPAHNTNVLEDYRFATAAWIHFKSVANQVRFIMARDSLRSGNLGQNQVAAKIKVIEDIARDEMQLARQIYLISKEDSRIGFEASNHYFYFPLDFVGKVINCEYILKTWLPDVSASYQQQEPGKDN
jgi:hypothetical protein